jgi:hypothetical protein
VPRVDWGVLPPSRRWSFLSIILTGGLFCQFFGYGGHLCQKFHQDTLKGIFFTGIIHICSLPKIARERKLIEDYEQSGTENSENHAT